MPILIILLLLIILFFLFNLISARNERKIAFFHFMAHRFRSPISIIRWYSELLSNESIGSLNEKQKEYLAEIDKASEKLNETIESLFTILLLQSNKISVKPQPTDIKTLIEKILQRLQFKIERHKLHLQENFSAIQANPIKTDPRLLGIALQYIIENAITYSPDSGNISIGINVANSKMTIEVKDSGYRDFDKSNSIVLTNYTNSTDMQSTLYIVERVLKKLNAKLKIKSDKINGTMFRITVHV